MQRFVALVLAVLLHVFVAVQDTCGRGIVAREQPFLVRPYTPISNEDWEGDGISYGPYRDGQRPGKLLPSKDEMREDLYLLARHWKLLRVYGSVECTPTICEIIHEDQLNLKMVVGAWISSEKKNTEDGPIDLADAIARNSTNVDSAILLANKFPDVVAAISIGNESLVSWSGHPIDTERIIHYIRKARKETRVPITVADDFIYWTDPKSKQVADELDFIITHIYAMWYGYQLEDSLAFTKEKYRSVIETHPNKLVVIGETGWATAKSDPKLNKRAGRIRGVAGEFEQKVFYDAFCKWTRKRKIPTFFFAAFDQNWKGPSDPLDVEKHWGLFRADRTPKAALFNSKPE